MPYTTVSHVPRVAQALAISDDLHEAGLQSAAISVVFPDRQGEDLTRLVPTGHLRHSGTSHRGIADFDGRVKSIAATTSSRTNRFLATGPILTILSGIGLRGTADALPEALTGLGLPNPDARHFAAAAEDGHTLIIVRTDEEVCALLVVEILRHHGGREIVQFTWPD